MSRRRRPTRRASRVRGTVSTTTTKPYPVTRRPAAAGVVPNESAIGVSSPMGKVSVVT